jgi:anionic cell wall polymer biosynthesis LytR-Cps2A-Psr (LCP) family protein
MKLEVFVAQARASGGRKGAPTAVTRASVTRPGGDRGRPPLGSGGDRGRPASRAGGRPPIKPPPPPAGKKPKRSRGPRWARLCAVFGALLMLASGGALVGTEMLLARYEGAVTQANLFGDQAAAALPKTDIKGPVNILLVGIDPRASDPNWIPRADSVLVLHVPKGLDRGYLYSLPRDLWVDVPAFKKANYFGGQDKLAHTMFIGAQVPGQAKPDTARGFELLAKTVSDYTGIERFDAGAIINFTGFKKIVDAMGGVSMYIDQNVTSIHLQPNGKHRRPSGSGGEGADAYLGPQKQYKKGNRHLKGWEALDYVRQRYITGGDYARQRHQQQFIRAMANQALSKDVATNPIKLDKVLRAAGEALVFDGGGHSVVDFALAMRNIRSESIVMVKLPGGSIINNGDYIGEELTPVSRQFFAAVRKGKVDEFIVSHPELVNTVK